MNNGTVEPSNHSENTSNERDPDASPEVSQPSEQNAVSPTVIISAVPNRRGRTPSWLFRFFWLQDKIDEAAAATLGPSKVGWTEYDLARDARNTIEEIKELGESQYAILLLRRVELLLLIRCHLLRLGLSVPQQSLIEEDWETARRIPVIESVLSNTPVAQLSMIRAVLGAGSEVFLTTLDSKQRQELVAPLRNITSDLLAPLEREAGTVRRLKVLLWSRLSLAAAAVLVSLSLTFGWYMDKAGKVNLALNRPVSVSTQLGTVGADHHMLVDGDHTNIGFHTDSLPNQFVVIDLGSVKKFDKVVVYNRTDCCKERAVPVQLEVSDDNMNYKKLASRAEEFDIWTATELRARGRYVRLRLLATNPFHLAEVEVY